jgi:nucleoside-diphosphate-sugar epimerase
MIDALAEILVAFPGAANRTRCFTHILNLVVKVILRQLDVPKAKGDEVLDVASQALVDLAGDIEMEEAVMDERGDDEAEDDDGEEGQVNPQDGMSQDERDELNEAVRPVRLVLVKVSSNSDLTLMMNWYSHQT